MRCSELALWRCVRVALIALVAASAVAIPAVAEDTYNVDYTVRIVPTERAAKVAIKLGAGAGPVEWIRFRIDPERHRDFSGDGVVQIEDEFVRWEPPESGGTLRYVFMIDHLRDERSYDARIGKRWAIFRGGSLVPAATVRTSPVVYSRSRLRLQLPEGWSAALPYAKAAGGYYSIKHDNRRFDRPTGWIVLGQLGVLREEIAGMRVAIAGPTGHSLRRMDILALLRWTLPGIRELFGELPDRLLVAGAGDPMWRGGLSGPQSLFVHAERPLISGDASSPLLHELIHTFMRRVPGPDGDWIIEGLAEYYSIEALRRSGTLGPERYASAMKAMAKRAKQGGELRSRSVSGATTAKALLVLQKLDAEISQATAGERTLDDVLRALIADPAKLTTSGLQAHAERIAGRSLQAFFDNNVPKK